jgi:hypothetical protein
MKIVFSYSPQPERTKDPTTEHSTQGYCSTSSAREATKLGSRATGSLTNPQHSSKPTTCRHPRPHCWGHDPLIPHKYHGALLRVIGATRLNTVPHCLEPPLGLPKLHRKRYFPPPAEQSPSPKNCRKRAAQTKAKSENAPGPRAQWPQQQQEVQGRQEEGTSWLSLRLFLSALG